MDNREHSSKRARALCKDELYIDGVDQFFSSRRPTDRSRPVKKSMSTMPIESESIKKSVVNVGSFQGFEYLGCASNDFKALQLCLFAIRSVTAWHIRMQALLASLAL